jgi:hypothetical protein
LFDAAAAHAAVPDGAAKAAAAGQHAHAALTDAGHARAS